MSSSPPENGSDKKKRRLKWKRTAVGLLLIASVISLAAWLNSEGFRNKVRQRVVRELESMTGGRVELKSFSWNLWRLHFEARDLTIHGLEPPVEEPYFHADRVSVGLKIVSLLSRKISLQDVAIENPTVHLLVDSGAITNQPRPQTEMKTEAAKGSPTQQLFDLAVGHVVITGGALLLNHDRTAFEFQGDQMAASLNRTRERDAYEGSLAFSVAGARWRDTVAPPAKVEANFLLRASGTELKSLKLATGRSRLEANGSIRNYSRPEIQLNYSAALDLRDAAQFGRIAQLTGGEAELQGALSCRQGRCSSQGNVSAKDVGWRDSSWRISGAQMISPYVFSGDKLELTAINGRIFRGSVQGSAQIENLPAAPNQRKLLPLRGSARLRFSGLEIREIATAVSTSRMPVDKIEMVGNASGELRASWNGTLQNITADLATSVNPPPNPLPSQVPVTAQVQATYRGDLRTLNVANLSLMTRALHLSATGELGSRTAHARLSVVANDVHELQPALDALRPGARIPVLLHGRAAFEGNVFGDLKSPSARGHLELEDFTTDFELNGVHSGMPSGLSKTRWASLAADLDYTPAELNLQHGMLRRDKSQFRFSFSAGLQDGSFDANLSRVSADLRAENASVEDIAAFAGVSIPASGLVTTEFHVAGMLRDLRGDGSFQAQKLNVYGESFSSLRAQLRFAGPEVQLNNLVGVHDGAQITGSLAYDTQSGNARFDLTGSNFDLATVPSVQFSRFSIEGKAEFHASGSIRLAAENSGSGAAPVVNGNISIANLIVNKEAVGNFNANVETRGDRMVLRGRSVFEDASLDFGGTVQLRGDYPVQVSAQFAHLDIDPVLRGFFTGIVTGHSSIAGSMEIRGPGRRPRDLAITGKISTIALNLANVKLQNEAPMVFSMDRETLRLEPFQLIGPETEIYGRGSLGVAADHGLDLHTRGHMNLKLAQMFNSDIAAYGPADFTVDLGGSVAHPQLSGRIELKDAGISFVDLPNGLSHIQGSMVFAQDRIQVEKLTAQSGGGELKVGGFLAYRNGLYFDLTATGRDIRLRYPPGVSSSGSANLRYTGSSKSSLLTGDITITRFSMNPRFDFAVFLAQSNKAPVLSTRNPFLDNLRLDVHIASAQQLHVETSLARLSGDVDLRLRGTAARPSLLGRVNIAEGDVFFNGTKFRLERGDVTFSNPLLIEPMVNMEMSARVQNYDITVGLHGTLSGGRALGLTYRSDPPLSNSDIIALLAFGRTQEQQVYNASQPGQNPNDMVTASSAVLGEALNSAVNDRVERIFGGSRVRVDPQFIGSENNPSPRVTFEQTIKNNVTLTYVTNVSQSSQTVIQFEYNINKDLSIVGVRDQNGVVSFNVSIRRRKK